MCRKAPFIDYTLYAGGRFFLVHIVYGLKALLIGIVSFGVVKNGKRLLLLKIKQNEKSKTRSTLEIHTKTKYFINKNKRFGTVCITN